MREGRRYRKKHLLPGRAPPTSAQSLKAARASAGRRELTAGAGERLTGVPVPRPAEAVRGPRAVHLGLRERGPNPARLPHSAPRFPRAASPSGRQYLGRVADLPATRTLPGLHGGAGRAAGTTADPEVDATLVTALLPPCACVERGRCP